MIILRFRNNVHEINNRLINLWNVLLVFLLFCYRSLPATGYQLRDKGNGLENNTNTKFMA